MNKLEEQAKFVQEALRAGNKVVVAVPRQELFECVVRDMIPEDLEIAARPNRHRFKFANGAELSFVPTTQGVHALRGAQVPDLAFYYEALFGSSPVDGLSHAQRQHAEELYAYLREHGVEMRELEMP